MSRQDLAVGEGREVSVHRSGPPGGTDVLLFHGMPGSGAIAEHVDRVADGFGCAFTCVNRPGYGTTSTGPLGLATAVGDALAVAEQLGIETFAVAAVSGGAPYAVAVAAAVPERVTRLAIAGGVGWWADVDPTRASWDPRDIQALDLASAGRYEEAMELLREQCTEAFGPLLALDDDEIAASLTRERDGVFRDWFVRDLREALSSFEGVCSDNISIDLSWDVDLGAVRAPVTLWYGREDTTVPLANGTWYEHVLRGARLIVRDGEGHGETVFHHWPEMVGWLIDDEKARR